MPIHDEVASRFTLLDGISSLQEAMTDPESLKAAERAGGEEREVADAAKRGAVIHVRSEAHAHRGQE